MNKTTKNVTIVSVYANWIGLDNPRLIGELLTDQVRGNINISFQYNSEWIEYIQKNQISLDPQLSLDTWPQYLEQSKPNFNFLLDSSPDRWGRQLMIKNEALKAYPKTLNELDFLLGVNDFTRLGALRFKIGDSEFLDDNANSVPPLADLRELEATSNEYEQQVNESSQRYSKIIKRLVDPGSSLGGARPKANIKDTDGSLWIAKFPSIEDTCDKGAWEMVMHELANLAGIKTPEAKLINFSGDYHTYLSKRFDRTNDNKRIHFASAMTLLNQSEGANHTSGASYFDFIDILSKIGSNKSADLNQLWRRIVFSICVSNTDDHLRNHGFILTPTGWELSPAYDINPNPSGRGLSLNINDRSNALSLQIVMNIAPYFGITKGSEKKLINEIVNIVKEWRIVAKKFHIRASEQSQMADAFKAAIIIP